jgi:hypothetical protein
MATGRNGEALAAVALSEFVQTPKKVSAGMNAESLWTPPKLSFEQKKVSRSPSSASTCSCHVHSRATARNYLSGIGRKCFNLLESEGLFADKVQVAVETDFLPWLVSTVVSDIDSVRERQQLVDSTVVNMLKKLTIPHQKAIAKEADRRALIDSAERKMRETLDEKYRLLAMKSAREAEELAQLTAFDAERLPVVVPDGTPQIYVSLVSEGGEDGPASASLRIPDSEDTETVLIAEESGIVDTIKELSQDEGAVIICYVTGEGDDRRVTAAQLQEA